MAKSRSAKLWKWSSSRRSGSHHSPQCHPVSQRNCSCGSGVSLRRDPVRVSLLARGVDHVVDPRHHRRPLLLEQPPVGVGPPRLPRDEHRGVTPPRRRLQELPDLVGGVGRGGIRREVADRAVLALVGGEVTQPLGGEPGHVVEEGRGRREELPVAGPPGTLTLRAVGRDVARVRAEAPVGGEVQLVQPRVAAREPSGAPQVGVHHHTEHVVGRERPGVTLDAHELEAVGRVSRLERGARAVGHHPVDLPERERGLRDEVHRPDVVLGDVTVRVERLAVGEDELGAGGTGIGERTHPLMFWPRSTTWRPGASSRTLARAHHARPGAPVAQATRTARRSRRRPPRPACHSSVSSWRRWSTDSPSMRSAATIAPGALVQVASVAATTAPSTSTCASRASCEPYESCSRVNPTLPAVPTVGQHRTQFVLTWSEQRADVVGLHLHARSVGRVTRA